MMNNNLLFVKHQFVTYSGSKESNEKIIGKRNERPGDLWAR
jgi:hypothetical protein